jgi:hypothetical protein
MRALYTRRLIRFRHSLFRSGERFPLALDVSDATTVLCGPTFFPTGAPSLFIVVEEWTQCATY